MSQFSNWKDGKKADPKVTHNVFVEGRHVYYLPTFYPSTEVKEFGGRWDGQKQMWRLPKLTRILRKVREYDEDATFCPSAQFLLDGQWEQRDSEVFQSLEAPEAYERLYPYQQAAVRGCLSRSYHGIIVALSPGLGKTPTSIVAADAHMRRQDTLEQRVLVVSPLPLVHNWVREIRVWASDPSVEFVHQAAPSPSVRWTVTNYDTILERVKQNDRTIVTGNLNPDYDLDWDLVIFDESILLKNRKSKRVQAARTLARAAKKVYLLSGAPASKDNSEIWAQFNLIEPDYFTSFWAFAKEFCVVVQTPWSQGEIQGSRRGIHIRSEFPELMFVRNQEEVFEDLPEYIYQDVELELTKRQQRAHDDLMVQWFHELEENRDKRVDVSAVIAQLTRLMQVTSSLYNLKTTGKEWPDESAKADYICEELDNGELDLPALIWVHHRPGAAALFERLKKRAKEKKLGSALYGKRVEMVIGGTKGADEIIEAYKAGEVDVLLLGITVGRFGHSLAMSKTIIYFDKTWDADAYFQSMHRAAGARGKLTGYHHRPRLISLRCRGTIDDYVELNLAGKLPTIADMTGADLIKLLRGLGEDMLD